MIFKQQQSHFTYHSHWKAEFSIYISLKIAKMLLKEIKVLFPGNAWCKVTSHQDLW